MRRLALALTALAALLVVFALQPSARAAKSFKMTTVVEDFVTTKWVLTCPPNRTVDMTQVDMTEQGWADFLDCLGDVEGENGFAIKSKTKVRNATTVSDRITSVTTLTAEQAQKLCDIVDQNPLPPNPAVASRPHLQELAVDGVIENVVIDLGNGCLVDLTRGGLSGQLLQQVFALLNQFATQNGTRVTGTSRAGRKGADRVHAITYLTPGQVQQILQLLAGNDIGVDLQRKVRTCLAQGKLTLNGKKRRVKLIGDITAQPGQQPAQNPGEFPIEIVGLELHGEEGGIQLFLDGGPHAGLQGVDPLKPGRVHTQLVLPFLVEIEGVTQGALQAPVEVEGLSRISATKPLKLKGRDDIPFGGDTQPTGALRIQKLFVLPTAYLPVFSLVDER